VTPVIVTGGMSMLMPTATPITNTTLRRRRRTGRP
jgi:hypothetical protein